ncbi:Shr3 amino acid permease chaperone [Lipomyces tetrasporus]|uniref:Shr3 amino acid permease chaperone n=1 Tax=Lipomyces tetrasporus TaxID=54092 RepID=A0AAD7VS74_9ASCO|nr:Shr3 amino acid permease chaperone [Lipomyces tetrasporus]KAJ8098845.1 Shr3 amino acid permease chaperone [Lipomyces tetrasporus]
MPTSSRSFSTSLILCSSSFLLGVLFVNWTYDHKTLWTPNPTAEVFALAKQHYTQLATEPVIIQHVFHTVVGLGLLGFVIKLYKPSESNKLFDGGSLVLFMAGLIIYLTNVRRGFFSVLDGDWGDVDEQTGINVIAASQVIIAFTLLGVLGLQVGQYYAEVQDDREQAEFEREQQELRERRQRETDAAVEPEGKKDK